MAQLRAMKKAMVMRGLVVLTAAAALAACAPAPLYTASDSGRGVIGAEIPRDALGEPVWHLIRPANGSKPMLTQEQVERLAAGVPDNADERDAEGSRLADGPRD